MKRLLFSVFTLTFLTRMEIDVRFLASAELVNGLNCINISNQTRDSLTFTGVKIAFGPSSTAFSPISQRECHAG
jgi:hypothetical protein